MIGKLLLVVAMILSIAGCATSGRTDGNRVVELEKQLQAKDETIQKLQDELSSAKEETKMAEELGNYYVKENEQEQNSRRVAREVLSPKQIQRTLKRAGYYMGPIDGKIGKRTKKAIRKFQREHGLRPDGVVGPRTAERLKKYL